MELKLDLEFFVRKEEGREFGFRIFLSKKATGRKGVGLRIICPSKGEKKSKVKQVRRGVRRLVC